jgi:GntR family transcriptional regulator/MocR family aminotransferase
MSANRSDHAVAPPRPVLGFGHVSERAVTAGIAAIGDLPA